MSFLKTRKMYYLSIAPYAIEIYRIPRNHELWSIANGISYTLKLKLYNFIIFPQRKLTIMNSFLNIFEEQFSLRRQNPRWGFDTDLYWGLRNHACKYSVRLRSSYIENYMFTWARSFWFHSYISDVLFIDVLSVIKCIFFWLLCSNLHGDLGIFSFLVLII